MPAATPLIGAGLQIFGNMQQAKANSRVAARSRAEERRRRAPYEGTAGLMARLFSGGHAGNHPDALNFLDPTKNSGLTPIINSRLGQMMGQSSLDNLATVPSQLIGQFLGNTRGAFDADMARMRDQVTSSLGARFGVRAGGDVARAYGREMEGALQRRHANAFNLLPNFVNAALQGTISDRSQLLNLKQLDDAARFRPMELATQFSTHDPRNPGEGYNARPTSPTAALAHGVGGVLARLDTSKFGGGTNALADVSVTDGLRTGTEGGLGTSTAGITYGVGDNLPWLSPTED